MAELFTQQELDEIERRSHELATDQDDAGLRTALQVLGEAAANLRAKVPPDTGPGASE